MKVVPLPFFPSSPSFSQLFYLEIVLELNSTQLTPFAAARLHMILAAYDAKVQYGLLAADVEEVAANITHPGKFWSLILRASSTHALSAEWEPLPEITGIFAPPVDAENEGTHGYVHKAGPFVAGNWYSVVPTNALEYNLALKAGTDSVFAVVTTGLFVGVGTDV